jgi:spore germination protein GerM
MYGLPQLIEGDYLNNFSIKSGGIGIVDLKADILKNPVGAHIESLFVFSIVDTLSEIPDITAVQITVQGQVIPTLFGSVDISAPLTRFMVNLNNYLVPYYVYTFNDNSFYMPVLFKYNKFTPDDLFNLLKTSGSYSTMLSKDAKFISYKFNGDTIEMIVEIGNINGDDLEILKRQIALSFTELPGVRKVKLTIGEESFILGR